MNQPGDYRDKEVVVLGLAKSGQAVAKVFHQLGAHVTVNDKKERAQCPEADELEALGVKVISGGHPDDLIHQGVALVVKNPGIKYSIAPIQQALALGIEVVTEVEVAYFLSIAPIIGITGSNGKTTTTTWIGLMLRESGMNPIVAGNIGLPLCSAATEAVRDQWLVVELSSFQLKGTKDFHPKIACMLNLYETHLDYHGTLEDYIASKAKLFGNQTEDDIAVLNWDDPVCRQLIPSIKASVLPFSLKETLPMGVYVDQSSRIVYRDRSGGTQVIVPVQELGIPGNHNVENAMAAVAVALSAGASALAIAKVLREFHGVEHRTEFVKEVRGVRFYNDSKATNPTAAIKAMEGFQQNIVWIAGGLDRGSDYKELLPALKKQVKAVIALGETRKKIMNIAEMAGISQTKLVDTAKNAADTIYEAVNLAFAHAEAGDIVLFSPACASWDMFKSYEERGRIFKESVHNL